QEGGGRLRGREGWTDDGRVGRRHRTRPGRINRRGGRHRSSYEDGHEHPAESTVIDGHLHGPWFTQVWPAPPGQASEPAGHTTRLHAEDRAHPLLAHRDHLARDHREPGTAGRWGELGELVRHVESCVGQQLVAGNTRRGHKGY